MPEDDTKQYSDNTTYLNGLRISNPVIIRQIYSDFFPNIRSWLLQQNASPQDAEDIFQDALVQIVIKTHDPDFVLDYSLGKFLFGVCRNLWLKKWRKKLPEVIRNEETEVFIDEADFIQLIDETNQASQWRILIESTFGQLSPLCQKVLQLFRQGLDNKEIAETLDMQKNAVYQRKDACSKRWRELTQQQPTYKDYNPY